MKIVEDSNKIHEALFSFKLNGEDYMIICYDFFNDNYWCKYTSYYGHQYKWVSSKIVNIAIKAMESNNE